MIILFASLHVSVIVSDKIDILVALVREFARVSFSFPSIPEELLNSSEVAYVSIQDIIYINNGRPHTDVMMIRKHFVEPGYYERSESGSASCKKEHFIYLEPIPQVDPMRRSLNEPAVKLPQLVPQLSRP